MPSLSALLQKLLLSLTFALFANAASAMFIQLDWLDPTEPGVGTNRYAYSANDPINKLDPSGNIMGNTVASDDMLVHPEWRIGRSLSEDQSDALDNYSESSEDGSLERAFGGRTWDDTPNHGYYCDSDCEQKRKQVPYVAGVVALGLLDLANGPVPDVTLGTLAARRSDDVASVVDDIIRETIDSSQRNITSQFKPSADEALDAA